MAGNCAHREEGDARSFHNRAGTATAILIILVLVRSTSTHTVQ